MNVIIIVTNTILNMVSYREIPVHPTKVFVNTAAKSCLYNPTPQHKILIISVQNLLLAEINTSGAATLFSAHPYKWDSILYNRSHYNVQLHTFFLIEN